MATHNYTCYANKSCMIDEANPTANYSSGNSLVAEYGYDDNDQRVLLGFDINAAVAGQIITDIKLYLYPTAETIENTDKIYVYPINAAFVEASATWNTDWSNYIGSTTNRATFLGSALILNQYDYVTIPAALWSAALTVGLYLYLIGEGTVTINSSHAASNKPYLYITTEDSVPVGTPISPVNSFAVSNEETTLEWSYSNANGDTQKSYEIETSTDGETWVDLVTATSSDTSYVVPANTFAAGTLYWRVKVTSQYDIASAFSAAAAVSVIGAPDAPVVSATTTPRLVITWSVDGQQAYQIKIGTWLSGTIYGTGKTYTAAFFLADGAVDIGVRVQNTYGLWSAWAVISKTIANTPESAITLSVTATHKAALSWSGGGSAIYYVYRDGVPIASTTETTYDDELAIGPHDYQVRGVNADGANYALSNEVTVSLSCAAPMITDVETISWQTLRLSQSPMRLLNVGASQQVTLQHYSGRTLPVAETSGFQTYSYNFDVAFTTAAAAIAFEALIGKTVCYKDARGRLVIGTLSAWSLAVSKAYAAYTVTIEQTDYVEEIDYA